MSAAGSFTAERMILVGHPSGYYAPGCMAYFRIYSRALTQEELLDLYNLRSWSVNCITSCLDWTHNTYSCLPC